jgi:chromosome segregation ATPase
MNEKDIKPHIESFKKEPSLAGILNFTQTIFNQLPEERKEENGHSQKSQLNADHLNSLMTAVQGMVNPTTLSLFSKTLNKSDSKKEEANTSGLENKVEQLLGELKDVKVQLDAMKSELAENNKRVDGLESEVQYLRRRRRR